MALSVGIVGLPNAGKSTLFNALLKKQIADTANYPFCTIEPNKGIVKVPDKRLSVLAPIVKTEKIVPAVVEFIDIAGLIKGASKGEGLGNQFLANIREVDLIIHVIRFFQDGNVLHATGRVDPCSDIKIIESELILADLQTLSNQREPRANAGKEERIFYEAVKILEKELDQGKPARAVILNGKQRELTKGLCLLSAKPVIFAINLGEEQLGNVNRLRADFPHVPAIFLCAKMESGLAGLTRQEALEYLGEFNLKEPGLNRLIALSYKTLGLISFLTAGEKEVRAWTIKKNTSAQQAAGVIHSDFEKNFIKASVISFNDFISCGSWERAYAMGKVKTQGKGYRVQDGDIIDFKTNA